MERPTQTAEGIGFSIDKCLTNYTNYKFPSNQLCRIVTSLGIYCLLRLSAVIKFTLGQSLAVQ